MPSRDLATATTDGSGPAPSSALNVPFAGGESLARMRYAVATHGAALGLAGERLDAMVAIVHELAANAVVHGGGRGRVRLWAGDNTVYCEVSDEGPGIRSATAARLSNTSRGPAPPAGYERGRGIFCVRQLADSVHIRSGASGTVVTACVGLARETRRRA
jgi:anti-sigma regulatory factor (Ser/Thr protein kinase)